MQNQNYLLSLFFVNKIVQLMDVEVPFLYEKKEREIHTSNIKYVDRGML